MNTFTVTAPRWILGPKRDLVLFILPPLFIIPLILALQQMISPEVLGLYVMGLGGFGHHLPGFIRAYADPDLFRQYKLRFTLVPALLISVCALYSFLDLNALVLATVAWGTWHGAMQVNGFARIYDSKVASFAPRTAWLDALMCLAWFGFVILSSPAKEFSLVTQFYLSGGTLIPPGAFRVAWMLWATATAVITVLFVANAYALWRAGTPANPVKYLVLGVSILFWWYCLSWASSLILGVLMWEIFHDVQYNALVWRFQRQRVDQNLGAAPIERALFRPGWKRLAVYVALILAYGAIGVYTSYADIHTPEKTLLGTNGTQWLLRLTMASALLHFYYDGFIWRIRQREIRQGLGLTASVDAIDTPASRVTSTRVRDAFGWHSLKWAIFLVPVLWLGWAQFRNLGPSFEAQVVNLSRSLPGSWISHFLAGTYFKGQGLMTEAEEQYRLATHYNPDFAEGHLFLGDILYRRGELGEAAEHYEKMLALDSSDDGARKNLGFLYLSLERPFSANRHFESVLERHPDDAELHFGTASALLRQNRFADAERHAKRTLELVPGHSGALNYLGMIRLFGGDPEAARAYYEQALTADPDNAAARQNLIDLDTRAQAPALPRAFPLQRGAPSPP